MKKLGSFLSYTILILAVLVLMFVLIMPLAFHGRVAVVLSSSMEPAMPAGALAFIMAVNPEEIKVDDIISFNPPWDRVVEILNGEQLAFRTKGDASEDIDPWVVPAEYANNRVIFNIPYLGNIANSVIDYVRTWWGLISLVVVPSILVIGGTIWGLKRPHSLRQRRLELLKKRQLRWKAFTR
jgi:signal peptidase